MNNSASSVQSLNVFKAQLLQVKQSAVLVVANQQDPQKVAYYFDLKGSKTKEQIIPSAIMSTASDFVALQAGSRFWVLTLSDSDRYRSFLTKGAKSTILKGFGLAKYQESNLDFDTFVTEMKAGKHNFKFN